MPPVAPRLAIGPPSASRRQALCTAFAAGLGGARARWLLARFALGPGAGVFVSSACTAQPLDQGAGSAGPTDRDAPGRVVHADPSDYLARLRGLEPGDTLMLAPGRYDDPRQVPGLPIFGLHGTARRPITISGTHGVRRTVLIGRATHNTIRFADASHVVVRDLDVDGRDAGGAGVAVQGPAHHITIDGLQIRGVGTNQQVVGIATVGHATWDWTIRNTVIEGAGTGMYLGNSDGGNPFIGGLIEHNVVRDPIGYCLQIKHQRGRPNLVGMPREPRVTTIRHNVFTKSSNSSTGELARPNLLVGHVPLDGPGASDRYEIHGNLFWQNPSEALFQGEGNVVFHANLLVNSHGRGIAIQPHNDVPRMVRVFGNTVWTRAAGITVVGGAVGESQRVIGNVVFADPPIVGGEASGNVVGGWDAAGEHLRSAVAELPGFDPRPREGALRGAPIDANALTTFADFDRDFDGRPRDWSVRGAFGVAADASGRPSLSLSRSKRTAAR